MLVPLAKTATGQYLVLDDAAETRCRTVVYCRALRAGRKAGLERQAGRIVAAATGRGLAVADVVAEVGSGLNGELPEPAPSAR